jgi:intracellular sulfur oxidation DsrE/DsrF family protein
MTRIGNTARAVAGAVALLVSTVPPAGAVEQAQSPKQLTKLKQAVKPPVKQMRAIAQAAATRPALDKPHQLVLQVNANDPAVMNLALNNASNVVQYYRARGETVAVEIVTFGPGLHMLRDDTSPVKNRIKALSESMPSISFEACGNTRENMTKAEGMDVPLISEAKVVESGIVRIMQRQEQGWTYVRP